MLLSERPPGKGGLLLHVRLFHHATAYFLRCHVYIAVDRLVNAAALLCFTCVLLQWVGRTLAASVGIGLVLVQVLSYYNVITVNWSIVHKQARQVLDTTGDG